MGLAPPRWHRRGMVWLSVILLAWLVSSVVISVRLGRGVSTADEGSRAASRRDELDAAA